MPNYAYKQSQPQSCAAACLMVAAKELGITQLPRDDNYHWLPNNLDFARQFSITAQSWTWYPSELSDYQHQEDTHARRYYTSPMPATNL